MLYQSYDCPTTDYWLQIDESTQYHTDAQNFIDASFLGQGSDTQSPRYPTFNHQITLLHMKRSVKPSAQ